jgi:sorbitol-6-phosphate 2-dehydrogenase
MSGKFEGWSSIVTGAGRGLGEVLALRLASEGSNVAVADIVFEAAERTARSAGDKFGVDTIVTHTDVTDLPQVAAMVDETVRRWGKLDLMVANVGIIRSGAATEIDPAVWREVIDVNLIGYFYCAREAARVMIPQKKGVIIQINSKSGKKGSYKNSAYAASKFAGLGLTQSLALELAEHGIRVNAICPGNLLDSPLWKDQLYDEYAKRWDITPEEVRRRYEQQVPLGRGCTYDDVANALVFLASDEASYMTGQAINVTGGQEMR